jgi:hypothetical protein
MIPHIEGASEYTGFTEIFYCIVFCIVALIIIKVAVKIAKIGDTSPFITIHQKEEGDRSDDFNAGRDEFDDEFMMKL